jgi:hypothetical protein
LEQAPGVAQIARLEVRGERVGGFGEEPTGILPASSLSPETSEARRNS